MEQGDPERDPLGATEVAALAGFADADDALLGQLVAAGDQRSIAAGELLLRQGDPGDEVMIVLAGEATVAVGGTEVGRIGPGDCVGEMALLGQGPRSATVAATSPLRALVVPARRFSDLLAASPALAQRLSSLLAERLRRAQQGWAELAGDPDVLLSALLDLQGSTDPAIAARARRQAVALVEAAADRADAVGPDPLARLSAAERRVAKLVAEGLSNQAIADQLVVSRHTVDSHVKRAFAKLGLRSRVELAALVIRGR